EAAELGHPFVGPRVVLVVAGYEVNAVPGRELGERLDLRAQGGHAAVDEIAGDHDGVGTLQIGFFDDVLEEASAERGADVNIGELDDREAGQGRGQSLESDVHFVDIDIGESG